jgi:hypothetical protein
VIEFARNVLGIKDADSTEFNPGTPNPAVVFMPEISTKHMGGTMRLGARRTVLQSVNCLTAKLYQKERFVDERHRHRCGGVVGRCWCWCWAVAGAMQVAQCIHSCPVTVARLCPVYAALGLVLHRCLTLLERGTLGILTPHQRLWLLLGWCVAAVLLAQV